MNEHGSLSYSRRKRKCHAIPSEIGAGARFGGWRGVVGRFERPLGSNKAPGSAGGCLLPAAGEPLRRRSCLIDVVSSRAGDAVQTG